VRGAGAFRAALITTALASLAGCAVRDAACSIVRQPETSADADTSAAVSGQGAPAPGGSFKIVLLGDGLTAGIGLKLEESFPTRLQERFMAEGYQNVDVINAGLTGETTATALQRLDAVVESGTRILVIAVGSNDALRGIPLSDTRENLVEIMSGAHDRGAAIVLVGMDPPREVGQDYQQGFRETFTSLSSEYHDALTYIPSLLVGVTGNPALNQPDGIRPNAAGARVIAGNVFQKLQILVDSMGGGQ